MLQFVISLGWVWIIAGIFFAIVGLVLIFWIGVDAYLKLRRSESQEP